jgi:hypothetical protein
MGRQPKGRIRRINEGLSPQERVDVLLAALEGHAKDSILGYYEPDPHSEDLALYLPISRQLGHRILSGLSLDARWYFLEHAIEAKRHAWREILVRISSSRCMCCGSADIDMGECQNCHWGGNDDAN